MIMSEWTRGQKRDYTGKPLTDEQKKFAEDYYDYLFSFMKERHLDFEEWYEILIIPYLESVKKYFYYEPAKQYKFYTVMSRRLETAMLNHFRAENRLKRKPKELLSLDYMVEGDNTFSEQASDNVNEMLIDDKQQVEQIVLDAMMVSEIMNSLTERQQTIFRLMLEGYTKTEIVKALSINFKTINIELDSVKDSVKRCISQ
jgi:DNA-directed RNA polymerase specialized sigma24 family protein